MMNKLPKQNSTVVQSGAMMGPPIRDMLEYRKYVTRPDAPAVHARLSGDAQKNQYCLTFNGVDLMTFAFPEGVRPGLRFHSDGDFQSAPFIQQFQLWAEREVPVSVRFFAPVEISNMRPERAGDGRAILGQEGHPLLHHVNGLYLPDWDLLISWHGLPFSWKGKRIRQDDAGWTAEMEVSAGPKPWVVLLRPHYYGEHLGYKQHRPWEFRPNPKPITGWCSWEAYHSKVTQKNIEEDAQALSPLRQYGLEYMQLDDGYQQTHVPPKPGDTVCDGWTRTNEKFPDGHEGIVRAMRAGGFRPGIWTNATLTDKEAADATDCCLRHEDGTLIRGDWIQYILDCEPETLRRHVTPYYRAFRDYGYEYCKSDALRHLLYDGLQEAVRLGLMEPEDARKRQESYMHAAREGLGKDVYYLSCWGALCQSIGVCDAMRVATDANPRWGAYSMQLRETARWYFAQRVMFTLDPDHVCVRGKLPWVRMMLSLVSLTGGLFMISDPPSSYDAERVDYLRKTLPALTTRTAETGPVEYTTPACAIMPAELSEDDASRAISHETNDIAPFSSLWAIHFDKGGRVWCVVQRVAVIPLREARISLEALALDPAKEYYAWNFWEEKGLRVHGGSVDFPALSLGDCTVLSLNELEGDAVPKLVGSTRHVSMDAVSVTDAQWEGGVYTLRLKGFAGLSVRYFVFAPLLRGEAVRVDGAEARCEKRGEIVAIEVAFTKDEAEIGIR